MTKNYDSKVETGQDQSYIKKNHENNHRRATFYGTEDPNRCNRSLQDQQ